MDSRVEYGSICYGSNTWKAEEGRFFEPKKIGNESAGEIFYAI